MILNNVNFYTGQILDNCIYASQSFYNGLIKIDINTGMAEYISKFPNEKMMSPVLYRFSCLYNRKIFFIPCSANNVAVFDVDKNLIKSIPISMYRKNGDNQNVFFVKENELWLIPVSGYGDVVVIDMDNFAIKTYDIMEFPFGGKMIVNIGQFGQWIYFGIYGSGEVIKYNIESNEIIKEKNSVSDIYSISKGRDGIWLIRLQNESFNYINNGLECCVPIKFGKKYGLYVNIVDFDEGTYAIPYKLDAILKKKKNTDYFEEIDISSIKLKKTYGYKGAFSYDLINTRDVCILPPYNINKMIIIDKKSGNIEAKKLEFKMSVEISEEDLRKSLIDNINVESIPMDLRTFIDTI